MSHPCLRKLFSAFIALALSVSTIAYSRAADPSGKDHNREVCSSHLLAIGRALEKYKQEHGEYPAYLSTLVPKYLTDTAILHCPADNSAGKYYPDDFPPEWRLREPGMPTSYFYFESQLPSPDFYQNLAPGHPPAGSTLRTRAAQHRIHFGECVPLLRCWHHLPAYCLGLLPDQTVSAGHPFFELEPKAYATVLRRLHEDAREGRERLARSWSLVAVEAYLQDWLDGALGATDRQRLRETGAALVTLAPGLSGLDGAVAWRLAARCLSEGGDVAGASAAVRSGRVETNAQPATKLLVETLRFRQGERTEPPVEEYLRAQMARRLIPGVSVAVLRNGRPLHLFGLGRVNLEHDASATTNSVYKLASITKTFVATGIMMLVEEGKVALDDRITRYLTNAPATWSNITVRHCLTHTSGLPNLWESPRWDSRREYQPGELIALIADQPLRSAPGETYEYNKGAFLLGYVIAAVTGQPFGEFLRERIFEPLGMKSTRLNDLEEVIPGRVTGYAWNPAQNRVRNVIEWSRSLSALADGGLVSNMADLVRWERALVEGRLLRPDSFEQMWTAAGLPGGRQTEYGLGWQVSRSHGRPFVGHFAGGIGSSARIMRFREEKLTVIVLCNSDAGDAPGMAEAIAGYYLEPKGVKQP